MKYTCHSCDKYNREYRYCVVNSCRPPVTGCPTSFKRSFILSTQSFIGFTSTSMERKMAVDFAAAHTGKKNNETDVLFVIKGKNGHQIEDFSQFGGRYEGKQNQKEVLFDKGSKFKFECMQEEDGLPVFYLTEI